MNIDISDIANIMQKKYSKFHLVDSFLASCKRSYCLPFYIEEDEAEALPFVNLPNPFKNQLQVDYYATLPSIQESFLAKNEIHGDYLDQLPSLFSDDTIQNKTVDSSKDSSKQIEEIVTDQLPDLAIHENLENFKINYIQQDDSLSKVLSPNYQNTKINEYNYDSDQIDDDVSSVYSFIEGPKNEYADTSDDENDILLDEYLKGSDRRVNPEENNHYSNKPPKPASFPVRGLISDVDYQFRVHLHCLHTSLNNSESLEVLFIVDTRTPTTFLSPETFKTLFQLDQPSTSPFLVQIHSQLPIECKLGTPSNNVLGMNFFIRNQIDLLTDFSTSSFTLSESIKKKI